MRSCPIPGAGNWTLWINQSDLLSWLCATFFYFIWEHELEETKEQELCYLLFFVLSHRENNRFEFYAMTSSATNQHPEGRAGCLWNQPRRLSNCKRQCRCEGGFLLPCFCVKLQEKVVYGKNIKTPEFPRCKQRPSRPLYLCSCPSPPSAPARTDIEAFVLWGTECNLPSAPCQGNSQF